jgi:hypothetical protein
MKRIILLFLTLALSTAPVVALPDGAISQSVKKITSVNNIQETSDADENPAIQNRKKKKMLRLRLQAGTLYDNNVYRYGQEYIQAFKQDQRLYRYPGVKRIGDEYFPLGARVIADLGHFTARANVSDDIYLLNSRMNEFGWAVELGWKGVVNTRA